VSARPKADEPRSLLRQGLDASHRGEYRALHLLSDARQRFTPADAHGYALCAAALMLTGQAQMSYRGLRDHIAALARLRDDSLRFDDRDDELLAYSGLLAGLLMLAPDDPFCATCAARILALLELDVDVNPASIPRGCGSTCGPSMRRWTTSSASFAAARASTRSSGSSRHARDQLAAFSLPLRP
jgi:hypothetical protein